MLLGAISRAFQESLHSGIPTHVRFTSSSGSTALLAGPPAADRMVERQLTYNVLTKEYKVDRRSRASSASPT